MKYWGAFWRALIAVLVLSGAAWGQATYPANTDATPCPSNPGNKYTEWYGERFNTAANDTFYIPDTSANSGFDLCPYSFFSFDFEVTHNDTNISDSVYVRLWTQFERDMSFRTDSATLAYAFDSSANDANWANKTRWFAIPDSTNDNIYWDRYVFAQVVVKTNGLSGTTYLDSTDHKYPEGYIFGAAGDSLWDWRTTASTSPETLYPTGTLWGDGTDSVIMFNMRQSLYETVQLAQDRWQESAGDGMHDWSATNDNDSWESEIDETIASVSWTDYIYVKGEDSTCVWPMGDHTSGYTIDSVVVRFYAQQESTITSSAICTLRIGLGTGDTTNHTFATEFLSSMYNAVAIDTNQNTLRTTKFASKATGGDWTINELDSMLLYVQPTRIGTTVSNSPGCVAIYALEAQFYYDSLNATVNAEEAAIDEGLNAIDYTDYIFAMDQDTAGVFPCTDDGASALYLVDSVVLAFVASTDSTGIAACTIKSAFMIGDTTGHSWGNIGTESPGVTSAFQKHAVTTDTATYYHSLTACPTKGSSWALTQLDSINIGLVIGHGDTTVAGNDVPINIYAVDVIPYYENKAHYESEIDESTLDTDDYIWVAAKDSFCVVPSQDTNDPHEDGQIDSVVFWCVAQTDSTMVNDDTVIFGICIGDTSNDHTYSLAYGDSVKEYCVDETRDSLTLVLATDPSGGDEWTPTDIDSVNFVFGMSYEDTTAAGNEGKLKVYQAGYDVYYNRHQSPTVKWKAIIRAVE